MSIDLQARLDAHDLLARFCSYLDRGLDRPWAELFAPHAVIQCDCGTVFEGRERIVTLPGFLRSRHAGRTRHIIQGIVIDRGESWRDLTVTACGPVLDLDQQGLILSFHDYVFQLRYGTNWRISRIDIAENVCGATGALGLFATPGLTVERHAY